MEHEKPLFKRIATNVSEWCNQDADAAFRRKMALLLFLSSAVVMGKAAHGIWLNATFDQRYETATTGEKIRMLTPLTEDDCSSLRLPDNRYCLARRQWASDQIRLIEDQVSR